MHDNFIASNRIKTTIWQLLHIKLSTQFFIINGITLRDPMLPLQGGTTVNVPYSVGI